MPFNDPAWCSSILTPALIVDPGTVRQNIQAMLNLVHHNPHRLRPHLKTHKTKEILHLLSESGINRCKASTISEVLLAASTPVPHILLTKQPSPPEYLKLQQIARDFPQSQLAFLVDHRGYAEMLSRLPAHPSSRLSVFLDIDCGMRRTGHGLGGGLMGFVRWLQEGSGWGWGGIHLYDGHIVNEEVGERERVFDEVMEPVKEWIGRVGSEGLDVGEVVCGGSPTFRCVAERTTWVCSPGTTLLWDWGYGSRYRDYEFRPAVWILARVISDLGGGVYCLDLGHKAVGAENSMERRVFFPDLPGARLLKQSEEHLVIEVGDGVAMAVGQMIRGIPWHICPTVALHERLLVEGTSEFWEVRARDREYGPIESSEGIRGS